MFRMHPELHALIVEAAAASVVPTPPTSFAPDIEEEANLYFQKVGCGMLLALAICLLSDISQIEQLQIVFSAKYLGSSATSNVEKLHP